MALDWQPLSGDRILMAEGRAGTWVALERVGHRNGGCTLYLIHPGEPHWPISPVHTKETIDAGWMEKAQDIAQSRENLE
ncbi:hypothetical protein A5687_03365 [Mycobacterium mantenii]|uniref:hypothetical protein n=1 Tax=Mycobacterium mantenii TaxID=560555 RepID=UPI0008011268|nr:hypothetical protein [Mycobacterium mantenii]OBH55026.1 hypothetical protein A5687_03365 [Mycobacterium mantenii]